MVYFVYFGDKRQIEQIKLAVVCLLGGKTTVVAKTPTTPLTASSNFNSSCVLLSILAINSMASVQSSGNLKRLGTNEMRASFSKNVTSGK